MSEINRQRLSPRWWASGLSALTMIVALLGSAAPARADITIDGPVCLSASTGTLAFGTTTVEWLNSLQATWSSNLSTSCMGASGTLSLVEVLPDSENPKQVPVGSGGSTSLVPLRTVQWALRLSVITGTHRDLAFASVTVNQPQPPLIGGPAAVTIASNAMDQRRLFVQAVGTPNETVRIAGDVNLDLSGLDDVAVAAGVQIIGDQSMNGVGPRLFTTTFPHNLLRVGQDGSATFSDHVRITGIRFDGGESDDPYSAVGTDDANGIRVDSSRNVEIDHSEIYRWRGAGVVVHDEQSRIDLHNASTVWVHDNYIHHDQHPTGDIFGGGHGAGYGVSVGYGGYALIEQNVFDYNRHAIMGDGKPYTGYLAYRNLILGSGGVNSALWHTHQIDMHGTGSGCSAECGPAGEYMDIRYNTIWYIDGTGIKLRGTPSLQMHVENNIFAHPTKWTFLLQNGALDQTETGLIESSNTLDSFTYGDRKQCDFDGDGALDDFIATGITWWYSSSRLDGRWVYLNTSAKLADAITLSDVDHDGRCDITVGGVLYSNGATPTHTDLLWHDGDQAPVVWKISTGGEPTVVKSPGNLAAGQVLGTGDFDADGDSDVLTRLADGTVDISLLDDDGLLGTNDVAGTVPADVTFAGIGDFDADRASDVLWRHADGTFEIWFAGSVIRRAAVNTAAVDPRWRVEGIGDFNADGRADILFHSLSTGATTIWHMDGEQRVSATPSNTMDPSGVTDVAWIWQIAGTGDFDGDGYRDILWRKADGTLALWFKGAAAGSVSPSFRNGGVVTDTSWQVAGVGDANGDGRADIFWRHGPVATASGAANQIAIWLMNGGQFITDRAPGTAPDDASTIVGLLPARGVKVRPVAVSPGDQTTPAGTQVSLDLSAMGATAPYTWTVTGLPAGLSSDAAGHVTGVPAAAGAHTYAVTATVTDAAGMTSTVSFSWSIVFVVPDIVGLTGSQAGSALIAAGLTIGSVSTVTVWDSSDGGKVMSASPRAGTFVSPGAAVNLTMGLWGGANR